MHIHADTPQLFIKVLREFLRISLPSHLTQTYSQGTPVVTKEALRLAGVPLRHIPRTIMILSAQITHLASSHVPPTSLDTASSLRRSSVELQKEVARWILDSALIDEEREFYEWLFEWIFGYGVGEYEEGRALSEKSEFELRYARWRKEVGREVKRVEESAKKYRH